MTQTTYEERAAAALLAGPGRTYAEEAGISLRDTPAPLFQLLYTALLLSARISAGLAVQAARALREAGYTTPEKMADATWQDRVDVLTAHGYKRYDESTSRFLGATSALLLERYGGDLRKLRAEADGDVGAMHTALKAFKGIGDVGANIFLREVQGVWREVHPFADALVLRAAGRLGLPEGADELAGLVTPADFPRFVSALVRIDLEDAYDEVRARLG
jgi:endonuclease III